MLEHLMNVYSKEISEIPGCRKLNCNLKLLHMIIYHFLVGTKINTHMTDYGSMNPWNEYFGTMCNVTYQFFHP